jgi:hypothetical protein
VYDANYFGKLNYRGFQDTFRIGSTFSSPAALSLPLPLHAQQAADHPAAPDHSGLYPCSHTHIYGFPLLSYPWAQVYAHQYQLVQYRESERQREVHARISAMHKELEEELEAMKRLGREMGNRKSGKKPVW